VSEPFTSIADVVRRQAQRDPSAWAITGDGRPLTFGELHTRSSRLANALAGLGVGAGDRVAYLDQNATEFWETIFAANKLGAALTPLNFRLSGPELHTVLTDCEPTVLVIAASFLDGLPAGTVPASTRVVVVGSPAPPAGALDYETLLSSGADDDPGGGVLGNDLAVLMYSSGTTGASKGVLITAANLGAGVEAFVDEFQPDADTRSLVLPPYYHIAASGWSLIAMSVGGRIIQVREPRPDRILALMVEEGATHATLVPAIIQILVNAPGAREADFSHLKKVAYGASPISRALLAEALEIFDADFTQAYGLTETVGIATVLRPADHRGGDPARLASAGQAVPRMQIAVVTPGTDDPLPPGETGEIVLRGPFVTPGYWRRPEESAALFTPGGWLRTGDAGFLDAEGYLTISDRIKDIIISGGENILPAEVERVLMEHPAVLEAAVVGVPSERWGETPMAFVALRPGAAVTEQALVSFCRDRLAHYKCPTAVSWVDALPRNPSGKVLRRTLREPYWTGRDRQVG
jgi:long-chain acyl-CoA synthetase